MGAEGCPASREFQGMLLQSSPTLATQSEEKDRGFGRGSSGKVGQL